MHDASQFNSTQHIGSIVLVQPKLHNQAKFYQKRGQQFYGWQWVGSGLGLFGISHAHTRPAPSHHNLLVMMPNLLDNNDNNK